MDYIRKMVKSLIAGYVITLLMLGLLTYFMRKFILDEKAVDNIIFGIYVAGSFTGAMLSAWMIKGGELLQELYMEQCILQCYW